MLMSRDMRVAAICASIAFGMVGLAYAAVPIYTLFCKVTGFGGTTQRATAASSVILERTVTVRFDANTAPGLGWRFEPLQRTVDIKIGENTLVFYRATNTTDRAIVGSSTFNVAPESAGIYFQKLECFCFKEQLLEPGQTIEMPVSFYVDPRFASDPETKGLSQITLSYTFHKVEKPAAAAMPVKAAGPPGGT
ncbi:MAG TPA: cytochrome c oxidase assembly protein [Hyphomicrobiaceae bacterium]|nr:cytochrome c oxidase assembly protein [Hyphomicrobiaceae bacterium]